MLKNYLKTAFRNLRSNKAYTLINILGLGAGIAGAMLIFLFIDHHLSTDRHQPAFTRTYRVVLDLILDEGAEYDPGSALPMARALKQDFPQVEKTGFIRKLDDITVSVGSHRHLEHTGVVLADQGYLDMFSFDWKQGSASKALLEPNTVVLSEEMAHKFFGNEEALGKILNVNNIVNLQVTGIVRDNLLPTDLDFTMLISLPSVKTIFPAMPTDDYSWISSKNFTFIRLPVNYEAADFAPLLKRYSTKYYGNAAKYYRHQLQPLSEVHFDERYQGEIRLTILWILAGVGAFLIIIACINFVNLATAQALKRSAEIGVRKALGSTRAQLFWQFMSETALVTLGAAVFALILFAAALPFLKNWAQIGSLHFSAIFGLPMLAFLAATLFIVIACAGFYPSVILSGFNPVIALKSKTGTQHIGGISLRRTLVIVQLGIAHILIIGTVILVLQLDFFRSADMGFNKSAILMVPLPRTDIDIPVGPALRENLMQYPEISAVTYQHTAPASDIGSGGSVRFDNRAEWEKFIIRNRWADGHFAETYQLKLLAGRYATNNDSLVEFVVNEEVMHRLGIRDPAKLLGRQLEDGNSALKGEIVGVVKNFHLGSLHSIIEPCAIVAKPRTYREAAIRLSSGDLAKSIAAIRKVWEEVYPNEVFEYRFLDVQIAKFYVKEEQLATLIRSFALVAIFICCLGLYGMVSFMVTRKTKEIGIRKVLGAGVQTIVLLFGKEFLRLVVIACITTAPVVYLLMDRWLAGFAYRIQLHWWILASGGAVIFLITLFTVGYQVARAAMADPVKSLKSE